MKREEKIYSVEIISNVPPGEVVSRTMQQNPDTAWCMGMRTYRFANRCRRDPALKAAIQAKVEQLRAEGFFEAHPPQKTPTF